MKHELERRGHRVSVFTGRLGDAEAPPDVFVVRASPWHNIKHRLRRCAQEQRVFDFSSVIAEAMLRVHRKSPIDVIEMEESFGWFADVQRLTSRPVLVKLHGPAFMSLVDGELETALARQKIEREGAALRTARVIVSPSESTLRQTVERYALTPAEARVIVNPLSVEEETPIWRLDACDRRTILFVGRFDLRKGADILLKAFLRVLRVRPDVKLVFVGPDRGIPAPDGTSASFATYRDSLFPPTMRDSIDFRGPMSNCDIATLRVQAMATVVASRWESSGYTLLEAMLQGCPIVSSDAGALRESIVHNVTGRLAKANDPADLAAQIESILANPEHAERMGKAARQYVIEHHSAKAAVDAQLKMYANLMSYTGAAVHSNQG